MTFSGSEDTISKRIRLMVDRVAGLRADDHYFYNQPIHELRGGSRVQVAGREMRMFASYSYLGLIGHPRIDAAAQEALERFGTGTHGVRTLAGSLEIHRQLEETIARYKNTQAAITYSSGYATNLTVIPALLGRGDVVISDKLNHASILDGCLMSRAELWRYEHNDLTDLERSLKEAPPSATKLVVADAVFSMDGDILDLPAVSDLCKFYKAWLMVDEAHSIGVLGKTGCGIEEHFGLNNAIDIKMGTLSKTIPSVGGYIAGSSDLIDYLRHASRAYIFSAAIPPAQAAAADEAFKVIWDEPWRVKKLEQNAHLFISGLKEAGINTLSTVTPIVPILCGSDELAYELTRAAQHHDLFVLPVVSPAVPQGMARLRTTVTAAHEPEEVQEAVEILVRASHEAGII